MQEINIKCSRLTRLMDSEVNVSDVLKRCCFVGMLLDMSKFNDSGSQVEICFNQQTC